MTEVSFLPSRTEIEPRMKQQTTLLVITTLIGLALGNTCPSNVDKPIIQADPNSCHRFSICFPGGVTVEGYCGGELLFDEERAACLPKDEVDCQGRPHFATFGDQEGSDLVLDEIQDLLEMVESDEGTDEPKHCPTNGKPGQFVLVPHETDCDKFYLCLGPKEKLKQCRKGQLFNPQKRRCDKAENVQCNSEVTTINAPDAPEPSRCPTNGKPGQFVLVPHETDCDKFYLCLGPKEKLKQCRKGQLFNPQKRRCDKAENVECSNAITTVDPFGYKKEEEGHCPADADPKYITRVAHETDCDKYYLCYNGKEKVRTCKEGKLFSERRNHCLTADKVDCGDRTTAAPEPTTTEDPETEIPFIYESNEHCPENNTRVTRVAHETDCDKYWLCAGPWEKLKTCREGKLFSARIGICLSADKVDCGDRTTEVPTTTVTEESTEEPWIINVPVDPSPITPDCPNNHRFELLPHPESCKKFFVCRNGEAFERECNENYVFDKVMKRCVKAEESDCDLKGPKPNPLIPKMSPLGKSCRKFVFQFQYRKYTFECKEGFWFDPVLKHCSKDRKGVCSHEKTTK